MKYVVTASDSTEARSIKGIVFNLLEEVVSASEGADAWDDLLDETGLDGAYTSLGSYPDEHFSALVNASALSTGHDRTRVLREFGRDAMALLATRYPDFFAEHEYTRTFLLTVNDIIHPEVRKLYPGADVPGFDFDTSRPDALVMTYRSHRRLCALAEGFIQGAARHFGETVVVGRPRCMHRGDDACVLDLGFR